jgi:hypothetical protein
VAARTIVVSPTTRPTPTPPASSPGTVRPGSGKRRSRRSASRGRADGPQFAVGPVAARNGAIRRFVGGEERTRRSAGSCSPLVLCRVPPEPRYHAIGDGRCRRPRQRAESVDDADQAAQRRPALGAGVGVPLQAAALVGTQLAVEVRRQPRASPPVLRPGSDPRHAGWTRAAAIRFAPRSNRFAPSQVQGAWPARHERGVCWWLRPWRSSPAAGPIEIVPGDADVRARKRGELRHPGCVTSAPRCGCRPARPGDPRPRSCSSTNSRDRHDFNALVS